MYPLTQELLDQVAKMLKEFDPSAKIEGCTLFCSTDKLTEQGELMYYNVPVGRCAWHFKNISCDQIQWLYSEEGDPGHVPIPEK